MSCSPTAACQTRDKLDIVPWGTKDTLLQAWGPQETSQTWMRQEAPLHLFSGLHHISSPELSKSISPLEMGIQSSAAKNWHLISSQNASFPLLSLGVLATGSPWHQAGTICAVLSWQRGSVRECGSTVTIWAPRKTASSLSLSGEWRSQEATVYHGNK